MSSTSSIRAPAAVDVAIGPATARLVSRGPSGRRGFSLLEILLAVTLLLAMAGIAAPSLLHVIDDRAFVAGCDVTSRQLLLARAEAQASGGPVEVVYRAEPPGVEARRFRPGARADQGGGSRRGEESMADADADARIDEPWARRALPGGVRMTRILPAELIDESSARALDLDPGSDLGPDLAAPGFTLDEPVADDGELESFRIAVFLPDGSTLLGEAVWIIGRQGRAGRLSLNPWTGLPSVQSLDELAADAAAADAAADGDDADELAEAEEPAQDREKTGNETGDERRADGGASGATPPVESGDEADPEAPAEGDGEKDESP